MAELEVTLLCGNCKGTGESQEYTNGLPSGSSTCVVCGGDGKMTVGNIDITDLDDKLNDIMDKCNDIFEQVKGG